MFSILGFANHLYRTEPIMPSAEEADFFVGRQLETESLVVDLHNERKGLVVVTGHKGVGKTSFVNHVQWLLSSQTSKTNRHLTPQHLSLKEKHNFNKNLIPCYNKIQLDEGDTVKTVLFKTLSSLLFSIRNWQKIKGKEGIPKQLEKSFEWVNSFVPTTSFSGGASALGVGVSGGKGVSFRSGSDIGSEALCEEMRKLIEVVKDELKMDGIFVCINNLEIVSEEKSTEILNQLRDYLFEIEGIWTVLVGYPGMYSVLSQGVLRVSEYVSGSETHLGALSADDVWEILNKRSSVYFAKTKESECQMPLSKDFVERVCNNSGGEIRALLKSCADVVKFSVKTNPNITSISSDTASNILTQILSAQVGFEVLSKKQASVLNAIASEKTGYSPQNYKDFSFKSAVEFRNEMRNLISRRFVRKTSLKAFEKYEATGVVLLAKHLGIPIVS